MIIRPPPKILGKNFNKYIEVDLWSWLKDLSNGLLKIDFQQNFQAFIVNDVKILAGQQVSIPNQFFFAYPGLIPSGRIITRQLGVATIIDGDPWTTSELFLFNPSGNDAIISVLFFK